MPRRTTTTETVEEVAENEELQTAPIDVEDDAGETALDGLLAEFQGADNVLVNVYRQGDGKTMSFLFKTTPEEMTGGDIMERCRDKFGTGDYRMHVREGRRIVANRQFSVEAPKEPTAPEAPQNNNADIIALIQAQNAQMAALFQSTMAAMAEAIKGASNNQPAVNPVEMQTSILQGVQVMKELADDDKKGEPGGVEMLIRGIELAKDIAPKQGETNMTDLGVKLIEAFPMLAKAGEMTRGHQKPPVTMPGHNPVNALKAPENATPQKSVEVAPTPTEEEKQKAMFFAQAKANLAWLCNLAHQNKDPGLYGEVVIDQMGREKVLEFLGKDDALEKLAQIEPRVKVYEGWFLELKTAILELTSDEEREPVPNESDEEIPDPSTVVARIDQSGLRREGRQGATVLIPESENGDSSDNS